MITITIITTILSVLSIIFVVYLCVKKHITLKKELKEKKLAYKKLLSQKKSSEVILGQVAEKLVPFTDLFPHDPQRASFLGNPIDYIIFNEDEIIFMEVKSGNSKLSKKQRDIRDLIKNKKVRWEEIKIKPNKN